MIFIEIWKIIALSVLVFLAGATAFFVTKKIDSLLRSLLAFSGAYVLGISLLHLLPEACVAIGNKAGVFILAGFIAQLLMEQLSKGIEHGHVHAAHKPSAGFVLSLMTGLCLHAFVEGIPLVGFVGTNGENHSHNHLLYGIILHHLPASFTLVALLNHSGFGRKVSWLCLFTFAFMTPLGAALGQWILTLQSVGSSGLAYCTAFVVGTFLHLATTILFESDTTRAHNINWQKMGLIAAGIGLSLLTLH